MTAIDVSEEKLHRDEPRVLELLLKDQTTRRNIVWATSSYEYLGKGFSPNQPVSKAKVTESYKNLIQPRSAKHESEQKSRTKSRAEVFTPTWIVDKQVRIALDALKSLTFEEYIDSKWLEITCGEGPYIVTPYDTVTGEPLVLADRIGFLDRKLQRISQKVTDRNDWIHWTIRAYQATYGYEYQGDSLLLARENLYVTFLDYFQDQFSEEPDKEVKKSIARIISYNIFQMDGLNYTTPYSEPKTETIQLSLFEEYQEEEVSTRAQKTQIKDWKKNKKIGFERLSSGEIDMKFDVVIGNPPYQEEIEGKNTQSRPIYNLFMDESYKIAYKSILITPARFLANTGATPKKWNRKMLDSEHFKILFYELKSNKVFPNTDIKGGVAISYYDEEKKFEPIDTFIAIKELDTIYRKVSKISDHSLNEIMYGADSHKLTTAMFEEHPELLDRTDESHRYAVSSKIFERYPEVFFDEKPNDSNEYVQIYGRANNNRVSKYLKSTYLREHPNLRKYKVLVPESNGSGAIGERLSTPLIGEPLIGYSQTFISIGVFESITEAEACFKYVKTRFLRTLLGILKLTQHNQPSVWAKVPLQDFTVNSDIDWSQSVAEIDRQLYKKYKLSPEEISFIETKVKEME